ncbi:MAG: DegT/DnrJ/EryC1/StrS family aminotransferase [Chloroflexota bacterium]
MSTLAINGGTPARTAPWPQWPQWGDAETKQLQEVLASGEWGGFNEKVAEFEQVFANRHAAKHCIALTNGTTSLEASLRVLGVGRGDEVIVPPYTFIATANAPRLAGATPVFADIEPDTYNLDPAAVEAAISPKTKAIIPVHFAGHPADMDALVALAETHNLAIIEDAAHAHGSTWRGQPVGTLGHIGSFSLQASKNLTAGEGGILITNDDDLALGLWSFVNQGRSPEGIWYEHPNLGSNLRITGWQAGILLAQMTRFEEQLATRMKNARRLRAVIDEIDGLENMRWDERVESHAHHLFMFRYNADGFNGMSRNQFVKALTGEGVPASTGYAIPLYKQPQLSAEYSRIEPCPVSEQACDEVVWLTQNMLLGDASDIDDIAQAIVKIHEFARQ